MVLNNHFAPCGLWLVAYICAMKILMVCLGNICRSPLAEGILQDKVFKAGLNWKVESAGTNGYHTDEPPHQFSIKVAEANGIDISKQKSRPFKATDFDDFDLIYAMAEDVLDEMKNIGKNKFDPKKVSLFLNEQYPGEGRNVPDPWSRPVEDYYKVFEIINSNCENIIKNYTK